MIIEKLELGPFASNCYIVADESSKEGMIIDPGAGGREIVKRVEDLGLKIKLILLTHNHPDHIGALAEVKEALEAEVAIHADDAGALEGGQRGGMPFGFSSQAPPPPDRLLKGGDSIDIGSLHFLVLHTNECKRDGIGRSAIQ